MPDNDHDEDDAEFEALVAAFNDDDDSEAKAKLIGAARAGRKAKNENKDLKSQLATKDQELIIAKANLGLNDKEMKAVLANVEGDVTAEALRAEAVALKFIDPPKDETHEQQEPFVDAAKGGQGRDDGLIKPEDVRTWSPEQRREFMQKHPDEFKALARNEPVRV